MPGGSSDEAYKSRKSFAFFSMFYNTVAQIQTISMYFDNRALYNRERGAKIYSGLSYWIAVWLVWFIFLIFHTFVFCIVAYPWSGFQRSGKAFFFFYAITLLSSFVTYFLAQLISASCPNAQTAMGIYPMMFLPSTLFCGYYQNLPDIIDWLKYWFPYVLSIHRW
jgi:ABC-type multidrug transport system permease subunit